MVHPYAAAGSIELFDASTEIVEGNVGRDMGNPPLHITVTDDFAFLSDVVIVTRIRGGQTWEEEGGENCYLTLPSLFLFINSESPPRAGPTRQRVGRAS